MSLRKTAPLSVLLFTVLFPASIVAQTPEEAPLSVGVSAPDSTQPVRDYRLPSWHWSQWRLDGSSQTQWRSRSNTSEDANNFDADWTLRPHYRGFWESEARSVRLEGSPRLNLMRSTSSRSTDTTDEHSSNTSARLSVTTQSSFQQYVGSRTFFFAGGDGGVVYRYSHKTDSNNDTSTRSSGEIQLDNVRVGIGMGRVRVVTPVIRALRVRERLQTVTQTHLSDQQVQTAARQLARRPGYQSVYDRPDKLFWRDFFERVGDAPQTPFETFYVADALREPVGVRLEGADVRIGPLASYTGWSDFEADRTEWRAQVGGFLEGRLYRNVTLQHQLGTAVGTAYQTPVHSSINHSAQVNLTARWLWVIADRIRLTNRAGANLVYHERAPSYSAVDPIRTAQRAETAQPTGPRSSDYSFRVGFSQAQFQQRYEISSDFQFFIENSVSLTAGGSVHYQTSSRSAQSVDARLRFSIDYVLSRALR